MGNTQNTGSRTVELPMTPAQVISALQGALQAEQGELVASNGSSGTFFVRHSKFWLTAGMKIKIDGTFSVTALASGGSRLTLSLTCGISALLPLLVITLILGLLTGPGVIVAAIIDAYTWHYFTNQAPAELLPKLLGRTGANPGIMPDHEPTPQTASSPDAASSTGSKEDVFDQLRKLAGLRDSGAITPSEYEAKKAEYMARL